MAGCSHTPCQVSLTQCWVFSCAHHQGEENQLRLNFYQLSCYAVVVSILIVYSLYTFYITEDNTLEMQKCCKIMIAELLKI